MPGDQSTLARVAWICLATVVVLTLWLTINTAGPGIAFFYAVPVGLTTWWFGRSWGIVAAFACTGVYVLSTLLDPVTNIGLAIALRAIAFAMVVVVVSFFRERLIALEHAAEELEAIRAALTPAAIPRLRGVDAGAAFAPSEYGVSGDFYLITNGPEESTIAVVGDVVGHGPKAAQLATFVRARLAAFAANTNDPAEILTLANSALIERHGREHEIVSAVCLRYQPADETVCWALAGHPPPLRLPNLEEMPADGPTLLLGIRERLDLTPTELRLGPRDDGVLVYTDGATDVRQGGRLLGLDGLSQLLAPLTRLPAPTLAQEAQRALLEWADKPISDDLCVLVLQPKGAGA
jgi:serine phosphatase RsbU (regulator of sigma subunit)